MLKTVAPVGKEIVVSQPETDEALVIAQQEARINDTALLLEHLEATVLEKIGLASDGQP